MPPDFGLRPPRPGTPRPQAVDTSQQASETLFNGTAPAPSGAPSEGERALLASAGATKADQNIRDTVDKESAQKAIASPHLVERVMNWGDGDTTASTVDPTAEAARIKAAQDANQPLNQGSTPLIEKQNTGWLGL